ncbi:uncharacterized protein LOC143295514 isoform X2 [Babylonia areolata]|uniref:uncharacterized protein LOC143295514 isoform X2 n=1 Tax=Babylonia areolata TaxID=304850 RepID=UPI003FD11D9E
MKVDLEVIASTSIKRRKPWPHIVWVGTKQQSLLLVDKGRASILYIPSGKTKQKIPQLSNVISSTACITATPSGGSLVGVQENGDVFLWNKDTEKLQTVCGLANALGNIPLSHGKCQAFASDDCSKVLVAAHPTHLCLWQRNTSHTYLEGRGDTLVGRWSKVVAPEGTTLPGMDCPEFSLHAMFASSSLLGDCCDVSMVFNKGANMTICSVLIRFHPPDPSTDDTYPSMHSQWKCLQYPLRNISSGCEAINIRGAYVPRYSPDGSILAVAVNQKSPADTSMLFVSPVTDMLLLSSMRGCGMRNPETKRGKSYWVSDMAWLCDNLFVACMLSNGSAALLSRLGEPVAIATHGCSIDMGPAYFLPLHPLISVQSEGGQQQKLNEREFEPSSADDGEPLRQMFSVSSHPTLPILVFSDGFMVTFLQLPGDLNTFVFMRNGVLESSKRLKEVGDSQNLDLTVANAYNLPRVDDQQRLKSSPRRGPKAQAHEKKHFSFEDVDSGGGGGLDDTVDSEVSMVLGPDADLMARVGAVHDLSSGKIVFGEPDLLQTVLDASDLREGEDSIMRSVVSAKHTMLTVWKVAASSTEPWTSNLDGVVRRLVDNLLKLFSIVLDCPPVSEALEQQQQQQQQSRQPSPAVQTASLFQVISLYRHLLELAQFDALHQHLAPSILHLAHGTMTTVLESRALQTTDPRLKTLSGCFTLLKFTEKTLNNLYVWLPKSLHGGGPGSHRALGEVFEPQQACLPGDRRDAHLAVDTAQLVAKRLAGSWKTLYKAVLSFQQGSQSEMNYQHASQLLSLIQQSLQAVNASVPDITTASSSMPISKGDKLSLDGKHTLAMNAWREQLKRFQETGNDAHAGKLLHSLLYTHLLKADLLSAVELIDSLVVQANVQSAIETHPLNQTPPIQPSFMTFVTNTLKSQAFQEPDMVPCIRDRSIRQVVQTLGRFMAAYFSNQTVYIFPPHNPQPLPAIHFQANIINNRILPKYHEEISSAVRRQKLSSIWTVERALEYLLLSGLVCEAAWFASNMGNWKTSFMLATACSLHRLIAPHLYVKPRRPLILPEELQPEEILHSKLAQLVAPSAAALQGGILIDDRTDIPQLSATLEDILVAGVMGHVEVAPSLLTLLVTRLKGVVKKFPPLVPSDFYLPAPPLYCPQPASSSKTGVTAGVKEETSLRSQTSSLVQLTLAVMNAAHVSIPSMRWYIHQLATAQPKAVQFKTNTEGPCQNFPDILLEQLAEGSEFERVKGNRSIHSILVSFRDLCSLLWMLHARDSLSHCLRKREKFLGQLGYDNYEKSQWEGERQSEWLSLCWACLRWAAHLLPFTHFLSEEASVHKVLVSMLLELAPSPQVADLMAEFFHDGDNTHPELQERLDKIMTDWQSIIVKPEDDGRSIRNSQDSFDGRKSVTFHGASPRGESLSVYFLKQQQAARKVVKKKQRCFGHYEEYVFARGVEPPKKLYVGARPFETKISFFDFLDMFCSVSFSKVLDKAKTKDRASSLPLLNCLCKDLLSQEMDYFVENVAAQAHRKHGLLILAGSVDHYASQDDLNSEGKQQAPQHGGRPTGLFRGKSFLGGTLERYHAAVTREQGGMQYDADAASPRQGGGQAWQLTVNFGKRYTRLQQLLEWLEVWSNKHHKFGLGQRESALQLRPSMKLQIPAQLIVLSLWLLEHKYSSSTSSASRPADRERGRRSMRSTMGSTLGMSSSLSPSGIRRGGNKRISPARGRGRPRSASGSPSGRRVVGAVVEPAHAGLEQSLPQSTLREADEVRTAYEQLLEVPDDSSSVVVSSLASDELPYELQRTNNALRSGSPPGSRRENSALNHTMFPEGSPSPPPYDRPRNPSPAPRSSTPTPRGRSPEHRSAGTSPIRSPPVPSPRPRGQRAALNGVDDADDDLSAVGGEGGLAQVLQRVIRKEMRRIVQIQQHSLNAMMGAIDGDDLPDPHPTRSHSGPRSQQAQGSNMRHALSELHNLQQQQQQSSSSQGSPVPGEAEVMTRRSAGLSRSRSENRENQPPPGIPQFLRIAAEREEDGFRLPLIPPPVPQQAWGVEQGGGGGGGAPPQHFPLLRLSAGPPQPGVYVPASSSHLPAAAFLPPPPPPLSDTPLQPLSFQHAPPPQVPSTNQDVLSSSGGMIGIPLLRLPSTGFQQPSQEPLFGRLVPPEYLTGHMREQERQEAEKQRHLRGFHQQMAAQQAAVEEVRDRRELEQQRSQRAAAAAAARMQRQPLDTRLEEERDSSRSEEAVPVKKVSVRPKSAKPKTPTPQSTETEEEASADRSEADTEKMPSPQQQLPPEQPDDSVIHDGYAIHPGVFEGYEHLESELGVEADAGTRFQYKMAQAMRRQLEKERERWYQQRKVDFATNTRDYTDTAVDAQRSFESVRTAEAATTITKDTGVDPVHEAIAEYNRTRQGVAIPPDVFLGLRFADGQEETPSTSGKPVGRAFLNVVDVDASNILRDIPERGERREEEEEGVARPASYLTRDTSPHRMGELEDSLRAQLAPEQRRRHDAVTVSMFERRAPPQDRMSVALLPRDSGRESKAALVHRLRAMNDQMSAMDEMSRNIESEFHHSKMILDTLQVMNDSYQPGQSTTFAEQDQGRQEVDPNRLSAEGLTPKLSEGSPAHSARVSARSAKSARSPSPSLLSRRSDTSPRHEASRASNMSGMSDISDVIGEVLADGGVDLTAAGLTPEEAEHYAARAKEKRRPHSPTLSSYKELQTIVTEAEEEEAAKRSPEVHRRRIHQWMSEKYAERQNEYSRQRLNLKEREHHPYTPSAQTHLGTRDIKNLEEEREARRQARQREDMERRLTDAEYLIGSAITDAVETKHELSRSRSPSPTSRSRSRSTSPKKSPSFKSSAGAPSLTSGFPRRRETRLSPQRVSRPAERDFGKHASVLDQTFNVAAPPKGILKSTQSGSAPQPILVQPAAGSSDFEVTGGSSTDLRDYMSAMQNLDSSEDIDAQIRREVRERTRREPAPVPEKPGKAYRPKPFTEMVRMQRPHVTRRQRSQEEPEEKYVRQVLAEKEAERQRVESARSAAGGGGGARKPVSQRSQAEDRVRKAYAPMPQPTTPRRVKTYTERLRELKPKSRFASPIIPRQHVPESASSRRSTVSAPTIQRKPSGPPHKPMTYVQQLKQINKAATVHAARPGRRGGGGGGGGRGAAVPKTRMPSRSAPHRPKTYTEQLQELNAPFKKTFRSTARAPSVLSSTRARPYGDPYSEDAHSVLSDWSMDDDVRKLLYNKDNDDTYDRFTVDGTEPSIDHLVFPPSEAGASDYYEAIMGDSDPYPYPEAAGGAMDYRDSVDVSELERIAEVASVGSGSVLSVIDWDAVDRLIEDV